jgi:hypothetical protein
MVLSANTYRQFEQLLGSSSDESDSVNTRMRNMPATVGTEPIFQGAADFDLERVESRTFDGRIQELIYRPTLH